MKKEEKKLTLLNKKIKICKKCRLSKTRTNAVPGEGPSNAKIMLTGEAPGARENLTGRPFIGHAGKWLDKILKKNKINRKKLFITSIVKCRPPENRTPKPDEIKTCTILYLFKQIKLIKPKLIVLLGDVATKTILKKPINGIRGKLIKKGKILFLPTYHPSAARFTKIRQKIEQDFAKIKKLK